MGNSDHSSSDSRGTSVRDSISGVSDGKVVALPHPEPEEQLATISRLETEVRTLREEGAKLLEEIGGLREKVDERKRRLDRVSVGIALIALICSLIKYPSELVTAYVTSTDTSLFSDSQISMRYDPSVQVLEMQWKIDARNDGTKMDVIEVSDARIIIPAVASKGEPEKESFLFYNPSGGFRSVDAAEAVPVRDRMFLKQKDSGSYICVLSRRTLAREVEELASGAETRRCIRLTLKGTDRTYKPLEGCFDLLPEDALSILRGQSFLISFDSSLN